MSADPYYDLLKANKEWASQSLGMTFQHYWTENVLPKNVNKNFAKIFMMKKAMSENKDADFFLFMDSYNSWFNPKLLFKKDNGALLQDIADQIPEDKHFILAPVRPMSTAVFIVRNSKIGVNLINEWAELVSGDDAPKCRPWDQAALYQVFVRQLAKDRNLPEVSYECTKSCNPRPNCAMPFEGILSKWEMHEFPSGLANDRVPIFHVLSPTNKGKSGIPRLMCVRCFNINGPVSRETADISQTVVTPGEEKLSLDVSWMINFAGDVYGTTLMPDTFGLLECGQPPHRSKVETMVIGVPFGGSKSIGKYLSRLPNMSAPEGEEVNFFNTGDRQQDVWDFIKMAVTKSRADGSGAAGFRKEIDMTCRDYLERLPAHEGKLTFDASSDYYFNYHAAEWIRNLFPKMKVIISLRDPTDRAYAEWLTFNGTDGREGAMQGTTTFSQALDMYMHKFKDCQHTWNNFPTDKLRDRLFPVFQSCINKGYKEQEIPRGFYLYNMVPWMANIPQRNVRVVDFNDLKRDASATVGHLSKFLGLPEPVDAMLLEAEAGDSEDAVVEDGRTQVKGYPEACEYYQLENERLSFMLNMNFTWCKAVRSDDSATPVTVASRFEPNPDLATRQQFMCRGLNAVGCEALYHKLHGHGWVQARYEQFTGNRPQLASVSGQ